MEVGGGGGGSYKQCVHSSFASRGEITNLPRGPGGQLQGKEPIIDSDARLSGMVV